MRKRKDLKRYLKDNYNFIGSIDPLYRSIKCKYFTIHIYVNLKGNLDEKYYLTVNLHTKQGSNTIIFKEFVKEELLIKSIRDQVSYWKALSLNKNKGGRNGAKTLK